MPPPVPPTSQSHPPRLPRWNNERWNVQSGWQRSHRIPYDLNNSGFWRFIRGASAGVLNGQAFEPWLINSPHHNGQPLPTVGGGQIAQHVGQHPQINAAVQARFGEWERQLRQQLLDLGALSDIDANPNTLNYSDEAVQGLLRQYSERARNLSDVIALISLDGFGDPSARKWCHTPI